MQRAPELPSAALTPPGPTPPREAYCRVATTECDRRAHWRIRHEVFVEEQLIFADSDADAYDADPRTVLCLGVWESVAVGAVRLFPTDPLGRHWQGDRLAVLPEYRTVGVGAPLVRFAVATARALGGREMTAHVQLSNVRFFEHLGWSRAGEEEVYVGVAHQPMVIHWAAES